MVWTRQDIEWISDLGFPRFGLAKLETPISMATYDAWLKEEFNGEMKYLETHREMKANPQLISARLQSALVLAIDYVSQGTAPESTPITSLRTALYAKSQSDWSDYHLALPKALDAVLTRLREAYPSEEFRLTVDSAPVLERDLAFRAGLGWVGKNTCVIDRTSGSLFFIVEILSSLSVNEASLRSPDHCGTCTRCIEACPTEALIEPRKLDARKCISYWTIESKNIPPEPLRSKFGDWFFGCDVCQTVCPWNKKHYEASELSPTLNDPTEELRWLLRSSHSQIEKAFRTTSLSRARGRGLKRNALIVAANLKIKSLEDDIKLVSETHSDPEIQELATWALRKINPSS